MANWTRLNRLLLVGVGLLVMSLVLAACSQAEEASPTATPVNVSAIIQEVMAAQPSGVTTADVTAAIQGALAQQPGVTSRDVANEIAKALSARPGVTTQDVASAIASALDERPGVTTQDVANEIATALRAQPGVTEDQVAEAIASALADRPGLTEDKVSSIVSMAMAEQQGALVDAVATQVAMPLEPSRATPTPTGEQVTTGGQLISLSGFDIGHTDQHRNSSVAELMFFTLIHPSIYQYDTRTWVDIAPDLADAWSLNDAGDVYTFDVRDGVQFSDGQAVTAGDMAYSLNRSIALPNSIGMPRWGCIRSFMEADGANAVDDSTLTVQLKDPAVAFLGCLASPWIMIQKQSLLEDIDTGSDPGREPVLDEVIGAGPFKLVEYRRGVSWDVERNPNYYDQPRPYLDKVRYVLITDPSARVAAFRTGAAYMEAIFPGFGSDDDLAIREELGDRLTVTETVGFSIAGVHINTRIAPFDNVNVRRAMQLTIDRQEMVKVLSPTGGDHHCYYPCIFDWIYSEDDYKQWPGFNPDTKEADIAEAQRLMEEAGLGDGLDVVLSFRKVGNYPDVSAILLEQWKDIGLRLELRPYESAAGWAAYQAHDFTLAMQGTGLNFLDPDAANSLLYLPTAGRMYQGWDNEEFNKLYDMEKGEVDRAARAKHLQSMTDILLEDVHYLPTTRGLGHYVQWSCVKGYTAPTALGQNNYRHDRTWLADESPCR